MLQGYSICKVRIEGSSSLGFMWSRLKSDTILLELAQELDYGTSILLDLEIEIGMVKRYSYENKVKNLEVRKLIS